jgi:hypothetical protein
MCAQGLRHQSPLELIFYWYELDRKDPEAPRRRCYGELCGCIQRLLFIEQELWRLPRQRDLDLALSHLEYHFANYLSVSVQCSVKQVQVIEPAMVETSPTEQPYRPRPGNSGDDVLAVDS